MNQPSTPTPTPTATLKTSNSAPSSSLLARLAHYRQLKRDGPVTATATDSVPRSSTLIKSDSIDSPRYLPPSRKPAPPPPSHTDLAHLPPGSPTLNRRRLGGGGGAAAVDSPIGTKSPKFFPKALLARPVPALVDSAVDAGNNYADLLKKERVIELVVVVCIVFNIVFVCAIAIAIGIVCDIVIVIIIVSLTLRHCTIVTASLCHCTFSSRLAGKGRLFAKLHGRSAKGKGRG